MLCLLLCVGKLIEIKPNIQITASWLQIPKPKCVLNELIIELEITKFMILRSKTCRLMSVLAKHDSDLNVPVMHFLKKMRNECFIFPKITFCDLCPFDLAKQIQLSFYVIQTIRHPLIVARSNNKPTIKI